MMAYMRKSGCAITIAVVLGSCFGCEGIFSTPIEKILNNPRGYDGKLVKVNGNVVRSSNLLIIKSFLLRDNTAEINIITNKILPRSGESVTVKGRVKEAFTIGTHRLIVIIEESKNEE